MRLSQLLQKHRACPEAVTWAKPYATLSEAWAACERGDWMLWLAAKANLCSRQDLVLTACACARLSLKHVAKGEKRPLKAIETAEAWARGEATIEQVRAAYAAYDAAYAAAAAAAAAAYAAYDAAAAYAYAAAAYAAYDAYDAAYAAAAAYAYAAYDDAAAAYATYDAATAASDAARTKTLKKCADLVRERIKV